MVKMVEGGEQEAWARTRNHGRTFKGSQLNLGQTRVNVEKPSGGASARCG